MSLVQEVQGQCSSNKYLLFKMAQHEHALLDHPACPTLPS